MINKLWCCYGWCNNEGKDNEKHRLIHFLLKVFLCNTNFSIILLISNSFQFLKNWKEFYIFALYNGLYFYAYGEQTNYYAANAS